MDFPKKLALVGFLSLVVLGTRTVAWAAPKPSPEKIDKETLQKKLKEAQHARYGALNFHVERFLERLRVGRDPLATVLDACKNLCEAGLDRDRGDPIKEMATSRSGSRIRQRSRN